MICGGADMWRIHLLETTWLPAVKFSEWRHEQAGLDTCRCGRREIIVERDNGSVPPLARPALSCATVEVSSKAIAVLCTLGLT